jgi:PAS domain S-box-containing protein
MSGLESGSSTPAAGERTSKLKQVEAQLRLMTMVFLDSADPIVIRDLEGRILDANHEVERVFGWTREEVLGEPAVQFLAPEWRELADRMLQQCLRGEAVRNVEFAVRAKGGALVPILSSAFLLTAETGEPVAIANILKDITQLKQTAEKLQQRNAQLQQFANVLAHDLAAPLRTIRSFAEVLEEECHEECSDDFREHLQLIVAGAKRMDAMIADLLRFVRIEHQQMHFDPVDSGEALADAIANLHSAIEEAGARVTHDPLPIVHADGIQLMHVFQNLIGNAIKFCRDKPPQVHVSAEETDSGWRFSVRDNGIGMDQNDLKKIFDVFRRLHAQELFPGTGIGLAVCKAVVERHGGRIWAESEKGVGSVFHFTISDPVELK